MLLQATRLLTDGPQSAFYAVLPRVEFNVSAEEYLIFRERGLEVC